MLGLRWSSPSLTPWKSASSHVVAAEPALEQRERAVGLLADLVRDVGGAVDDPPAREVDEPAVRPDDRVRGHPGLDFAAAGLVCEQARQRVGVAGEDAL